MRNLFIIGNGFDLAHGMKTSYDDFYQYIKKKYPNLKEENNNLPEAIFGRKGGITYDEKELTEDMLNLLHHTGEWNKFESNLGEIDFFYDDYSEPVFDKEGDPDISKTMILNESKSSVYSELCYNLKSLFKEWIQKIRILKRYRQEYFENKFKKNNLFFTFNYTKTLEKLYNIPLENILHIHGTLPKDLIFGHNLKLEDIEIESKNIGIEYSGLEHVIYDCKNIFRKKIDEIIKKYEFFFDKIQKYNVEKVYIYGFSFSEIDLPYLSEIIKNTPNNIIWEITFHNKNDKEIFFKKLRRLGIKKKNIKLLQL